MKTLHANTRGSVPILRDMILIFIWWYVYFSCARINLMWDLYQCKTHECALFCSRYIVRFLWSLWIHSITYLRITPLTLWLLHGELSSSDVNTKEVKCIKPQQSSTNQDHVNISGTVIWANIGSKKYSKCNFNRIVFRRQVNLWFPCAKHVQNSSSIKNRLLEDSGVPENYAWIHRSLYCWQFAKPHTARALTTEIEELNFVHHLS